MHIVIHVEGGLVKSVFTDQQKQDVDVEILDLDMDEAPPKERSRQEARLEKVQETMVEVY